MPFVFGDGFELESDGEKALAKRMGCLWANFAHTGDPNAGTCGATPAAAWPRFRAGDEETMVLDVGKLAPEQGLKTDVCEAFFGKR